MNPPRAPLLYPLSLIALLGATPALATQAWVLDSAELSRAQALSPAVVEAHALQLDQPPPPPGERWSLQLPEGWSDWRSVRLDAAANGDFRWRGQGLDDASQQAIVVRHQGALSGVIWTRHGHYEIASDAQGQLLLQLDDRLFPACAGAEHAGDHGQRALDMIGSGLGPVLPAGSTVEIDVLVVYSPQARDTVGGTAQIEALAQAAVDAANLSFENAQSTPRFRLVGARLTSRNDSGDGSADLSWVRNDPTVAQWRNEVGADMVALIAEDIGSGCGIGYVMRNPGPGFAGSAFQVTARGCAVGNLTYAHEHGHNMGMEHDPANGTTPGSASFPWAFGHFVNASYRTVMSYSNQCAGGCTRRPYFSNPDVIFNGVPTGIAEQRHNARTADSVAAIVAAFRAPVTIDGLFEDGFE